MTNCPICKNLLDTYIKNKKLTILKCLNCSLGITDNLNKQIGDYHRDEVYIKEDKLFNNIFRKRVNIIQKFKRSGKVLEIGCSTGLMLLILKNKGWQVKGVEISSKAADAAKKRGVEIMVGDFSKLEFKEKFDLIILNHTLEHLENPEEILKKINNLLSLGGLLYIDVPNFGGLSAKLMGKKWPLLLPNEHLWHFTEESLRILLQNLGFEIIFVEKASGVWDYGNPLWGILLSLVTFKKRFFGEVLTVIPSWIVTKLGIGSDLMIIAKKT